VSETDLQSSVPESNRAPAVPEEIQLIVDALDDKRALDVRVLKLEEVSESLEWFVVATGESSLQLRALEDGIRERLKVAKVPLRAVEGPSSRWVLMDYGTFVVHLMSPEARSFYDIEGLWADAPVIPVVAR
jgi:ribosome-associated protein